MFAILGIVLADVAAAAALSVDVPVVSTGLLTLVLVLPRHVLSFLAIFSGLLIWPCDFGKLHTTTGHTRTRATRS